MLPILGGNNRARAWAARISAGQESLRRRCDTAGEAAKVKQRLADLFVTAEQALSDKPPARAALLEALSSLEDHTSSAGRLSLALFEKLQAALGTETGLRRLPSEPQVPGHRPASTAALPAIMSSTFEWFEAESFLELHPVEQAALVHTRLIDLQPFPVENTRLARLGADLFLLRAQLPPLIIAAERNAYKRVLHQAILLDTQPLVELLALATERALEELAGSE